MEIKELIRSLRHCEDEASCQILTWEEIDEIIKRLKDYDTMVKIFEKLGKEKSVSK